MAQFKARFKSAYAAKTHDGKLFSDERKAAEHGEGLRAEAFLSLINAMIPEAQRNHLSSNDWFKVQCADLQRSDDSELLKALKGLLDIVEFENQPEDGQE